MRDDERVWRLPPASLALAADDVHVWRVALDRPAAEVSALARLLSSTERERVARLHFQRDRDRFVAGRAALRVILSAYTHTDPHDLAFRLGPHGKPALERESRSVSQKDALQFSVSHSDGVALFAFARGRQVGVDIERVRRLDDADQIAQRFFAAAECVALARLPAELRLSGFFACWTRKEAYLKALGDGLSRPLDQFTVSLAPGEPAALLDVAGEPDEVRRWRFLELAPATDHVGALVVEGHDWRLSCWRVAESAPLALG